MTVEIIEREQERVLVGTDKESWINKNWRSAVAWQYIIVCLFDFVIAPVLFAVLAIMTKTPIVPWKPLTTAEAGLYHLAMGAICGVTSWGRSQEKVANIK